MVDHIDLGDIKDVDDIFMHVGTYPYPYLKLTLFFWMTVRQFIYSLNSREPQIKI